MYLHFTDFHPPLSLPQPFNPRKLSHGSAFQSVDILIDNKCSNATTFNVGIKIHFIFGWRCVLINGMINRCGGLKSIRNAQLTHISDARFKCKADWRTKGAKIPPFISHRVISISIIIDYYHSKQSCPLFSYRRSKNRAKGREEGYGGRWKK